MLQDHHLGQKTFTHMVSLCTIKLIIKGLKDSPLATATSHKGHSISDAKSQFYQALWFPKASAPAVMGIHENLRFHFKKQTAFSARQLWRKAWKQTLKPIRRAQNDDDVFSFLNYTISWGLTHDLWMLRVGKTATIRDWEYRRLECFDMATPRLLFFNICTSCNTLV